MPHNDSILYSSGLEVLLEWPINNTIPLGSILGHNLSLLYNNDLPDEFP